MADYYWSRDWTDWKAFPDDEARARASEERLKQRRIDWPITHCKPLPSYVRSERQAAWEHEQCTISNDRFFRALRKT